MRVGIYSIHSSIHHHCRLVWPIEWIFPGFFLRCICIVDCRYPAQIVETRSPVFGSSIVIIHPAKRHPTGAHADQHFQYITTQVSMIVPFNPLGKNPNATIRYILSQRAGRDSRDTLCLKLLKLTVSCGSEISARRRSEIRRFCLLVGGCYVFGTVTSPPNDRYAFWITRVILRGPFCKPKFGAISSQAQERAPGERTLAPETEEVLTLLLGKPGHGE